MNNFKKPLITIYKEFIFIKARRGQTSHLYFGFFRDYVLYNYKPILMEWWEYQLRASMERNLPNQLYTIGMTPHLAQTGKGGYIEFTVSMHKIARNF